MTEYDELYVQARRLAKRYVSDHAEGRGHLPVLQEAIAGARTAGEYAMGIVEVPLKKVIGTYLQGRRPAFAGNFMPLLPSNSELAFKWVAVCQAHNEEGLRDAIRAYEYLGYYYVVEGHKRVSVLKASNAYSVTADVIRILPVWQEDDSDVAVLYEYYQHNRRMPVLHMWFSRPGRLSLLFDMAARASADSDEADALLKDCFTRFRMQYHANGYAPLSMTTGDAFFEYVQVFGLCPDKTPADMKDSQAACLKQWQYSISRTRPEAAAVAEERRAAVPLLGLLGTKPRPLTLAFAFEGQPGDNEVTHLHDMARRQLERLHLGVSISVQEGLPPGEAAWTTLSSQVADEPDFLFVPSASHAQVAWRASLFANHTRVVHMCPLHPQGRRLSTCWGRPEEPALLCGALAGLKTVTGRVALGVTQPEEAAAFAAGVALTNARARVLCHARQDAASWRHIRAAFAAHKADVAWLPAGSDRRMAIRYFTGVYACLCELSVDDATIQEIWAAAAWHWGAFYNSLAEGAFDGMNGEEGAFAAPASCLRLGLASGLMDVHMVEALLSPGTLRLMRLLRDAVMDGQLANHETLESMNHVIMLET